MFGWSFKPTHMGNLSDLLSKTMEGDIVPDGFYTVRQWAEMEGKSIPTAGRMVKVLHERGDLEQCIFKVKSGNQLKHVPHYRIIAD